MSGDGEAIAKYMEEMKAFRETAEELCSRLKSGTVTPDEGEEMRQKLIPVAVKARMARRNLLIHQERRKLAVKRFSEEVMVAESQCLIMEEDVCGAEQCLSILKAQHEKQKDISGKLSISVEEFLAKNPLPEGTTESHSAQIRRRIQYEIDLSKDKARQLKELTKEKVLLNSKSKNSKKFFVSAAKPLEELRTKLHRSLGAISGGQGSEGLILDYLPPPLYVLYNALLQVQHNTVSVEGSQGDVEAFLQSGRHQLSTGTLELFPLRVTCILQAEVLPGRTHSPALRFYMCQQLEQVVIEAVEFDRTILAQLREEEESEAVTYQAFNFKGDEVKGIVPQWVQRAATAECSGESGYSTAHVEEVITGLVERIRHRHMLLKSLQTLKEKGSLTPPNITKLVQAVFPGYPDPRIAVGDIKVENLPSPDIPSAPEKPVLEKPKVDYSSLGEKPKEPEGAGYYRRREYQEQLANYLRKQCDLDMKAKEEYEARVKEAEQQARKEWEQLVEVSLPKSIQFKIELDHVQYKVKGEVGPQYPTQPPQFQLRAKYKEDEERKSAVLRVPQSLHSLARTPVVLPVESSKADTTEVNGAATPTPPGDTGTATPTASSTTQSFRSVQQFCFLTPQAKRRKRKKEVEPLDVAALAVEPNVLSQEIQEYFCTCINRDVVRGTPTQDRQQVLLRQILTAIYFIEQVHPHMASKGSSRIWYVDRPLSALEIAGSQHTGGNVRILGQGPCLRRGREAHLPLTWDPSVMKWVYGDALAKEEPMEVDDPSVK